MPETRAPRSRRRHDGLRKLCSCQPHVWPRCSHSWYLNFKHGDVHHRHSLDRYVGHHVTSKGEARAIAIDLRAAIKAGACPACRGETVPTAPTALTFAALAEKWLTRAREEKVASWKTDRACVAGLGAIAVGDVRLGDQLSTAITEDDLEVAFATLKAQGKAASTRRHYRQTLRGLEAWARRKGYLERPWLSDEADLQQEGFARRHRRLVPDRFDDKGQLVEPGEERRLLQVAGPFLSSLIIAALESCCRQGELLSLQWADVDLPRGRFTIRAEKAKTRKSRTLPMTARLRALFDNLKTDKFGRRFPPEAYPFGNGLGHRVASPKKAWGTAVLKAHGHKPAWTGKGKLALESRAALEQIDLHFHDLRREGASRLHEAGMPLHHVQAMLGHADLKQTSTYLAVELVGLEESMKRLEALQAVASTPAGEHQPSSNVREEMPANPM